MLDLRHLVLRRLFNPLLLRYFAFNYRTQGKIIPDANFILRKGPVFGQAQAWSADSDVVTESSCGVFSGRRRVVRSVKLYRLLLS